MGEGIGLLDGKAGFLSSELIVGEMLTCLASKFEGAHLRKISGCALMPPLPLERWSSRNPSPERAGVCLYYGAKPSRRLSNEKCVSRMDTMLEYFLQDQSEKFGFCEIPFRSVLRSR